MVWQRKETLEREVRCNTSPLILSSPPHPSNTVAEGGEDVVKMGGELHGSGGQMTQVALKQQRQGSSS